MKMIRLFLFFGKLGFYRREVLNDRRVVVVGIPSREGGPWAKKRAFWGNAFRTNAKAPLEIYRRQVSRRRSNAHLLQCSESSLPVTMAIRVLASQPANKVAIVEVKTKEGTSV
jgi:hypothetical protein